MKICKMENPIAGARRHFSTLSKTSLGSKKALFICQNPSFDRLFFTKIVPTLIQEERLFPYNWLDLASMHWARCIREGALIQEIGLSKDLIARHYAISPEDKPHRALNGVHFPRAML